MAPGSSIDDDEEVEAADVEVEVDHGTAGATLCAEDTYLLEYHSAAGVWRRGRWRAPFAAEVTAAAEGKAEYV